MKKIFQKIKQKLGSKTEPENDDYNKDEESFDEITVTELKTDQLRDEYGDEEEDSFDEITVTELKTDQLKDEEEEESEGLTEEISELSIDDLKQSDEDSEETIEITELSAEDIKSGLTDGEEPPEFPFSPDDEDNETEFDQDETVELKTLHVPKSEKRKFQIEQVLKNISALLPLNLLKKNKDKNETSNAFKDIIAIENRQFIHRLFIFSCLLCFTYFSGKTLALLLTPKNNIAKTKKSATTLPPRSNTQSEMRYIASKNLFNAKESFLSKAPVKKKKVEKKVKDTSICKKAKKKSSIGVKYLSSTILQDSSKSLASLSTPKNKKVVNFRTGDKIEEIATVGKITVEKLFIRNFKTGNCEYIANKGQKEKSNLPDLKIYPESHAKNILPSTPGIVSEGNKLKIKKSLRDEMLSNISEVLTQARAIQMKNPDGSLKFKITDITPGSIYSKLNIQNNDIITKINGSNIENLNEVMSMFGRIKDISNLSITIDRNGIESDFEYQFD